MRKLLLLVLTLTASASPPVHDEKLPFRDQPFDHVVKADVLPVVKKEPIVQHTEAEQDPLMQDEPVADVVEPDSVLLEPERTEEHRITEDTSVIVEEPVLEADYLTEEMPETELKPELEIAPVQMNRNNIPVEEPAVELESVAEMESEKEEHLLEEPTLESDFIVNEDPEEVMEPVMEQRMALQTEQDPLMQDEPVADVMEPDSVLLEPERTEEEETSVIVEEPVLEADYLTEEMPETELKPELEIAPVQMNRNNIPVEEPAVELESVAEMESEKEEHLLEEPTLEGDFIVDEDPEEVMEPVMERRMALQTEQDPLMQDEPVADVMEPDSVLLEPERTEEEETSVIVEEPVLEADYLTEEMPETELKPELEIAPVQMNRNNIPVEEPAVELESVAEMESEKEEHLLEEPTLEGDFIVDEDPEEVMEPVMERRMALQTEQDPLMQDEPVADVMEPDSVLLEPERTEEEETSVIVEEPVLEADYLTEEMPETELKPELEIAAVQMNRNNIPVEEPAVELESVAEMESEKEEHLLEEPTLEGDFIVDEDPEEVMEPVRERRMTLQTGRWSCRGVVLQGKCYQSFRRNLDANTAEVI